MTIKHMPECGKIIESDETRDAVHIALAPVVAKQPFKPGEPCGADGTIASPVGIVDPFLTRPVKAGQKFWLFLYPNTITSLRHEWTHPAFEAAEKASSLQEAERFVRGWVGSNLEVDYEVFIAAAKCGQASDGSDYWGGLQINNSYLLTIGNTSYGEVPDAARLWEHVKTIIGQEPAGRPTEFSCSC